MAREALGSVQSVRFSGLHIQSQGEHVRKFKLASLSSAISDLPGNRNWRQPVNSQRTEVCSVGSTCLADLLFCMATQGS